MVGCLCDRICILSVGESWGIVGYQGTWLVITCQLQKLETISLDLIN